MTDFEDFWVCIGIAVIIAVILISSFVHFYPPKPSCLDIYCQSIGYDKSSPFSGYYCYRTVSNFTHEKGYSSHSEYYYLTKEEQKCDFNIWNSSTIVENKSDLLWINATLWNETNEEYLAKLNGTCHRAGDCFMNGSLKGCYREDACNWCCSEGYLPGCTLVYCMNEKEMKRFNESWVNNSYNQSKKAYLNITYIYSNGIYTEPDADGDVIVGG